MTQPDIEPPNTRRKPPPTPQDATVELARRGRIEALPSLGAILDANPRLTERCGDMATMAETAWIVLIAGRDLVQTAALKERLRALRLELGGPAPSALIKQLVNRLAVAWLECQYVDLLAALNRTIDGQRTARLRLKQRESADKRFLAATRTLALVRRYEGSKVPKAAPERPEAAKVEWPPAATPSAAVPCSEPLEEATPLSDREAAARDAEILLASAPMI